MLTSKNNSAAGFSMIELIIVIVVISIMTAVSMVYLNSSQRLYKPDAEALKIIDIFQEARQRSLTQRRTMRVEIDMDDKVIRLINEEDPATATDDALIRTMALLPASEITIDKRPFNITDNPPEPFPAPHANFYISHYPNSVGHRVCTIRFQSTGTVVNAGSDATGTGATPTGVALFIWAPDQQTVTNSDIARAITIIGTTGSVRLWEYDKQASTANKWKDSRRTSGFGG